MTFVNEGIGQRTTNVFGCQKESIIWMRSVGRKIFIGKEKKKLTRTYNIALVKRKIEQMISKELKTLGANFGTPMCMPNNHS